MSADVSDKQAAELAVVDDQITAALARVAEHSADVTRRVARAVALANATTLVRGAIAKHWGALAALKDTPFGFATDEREGRPPYSTEQLQVALTHGILLGGLPTGGEITVISARAYLSLPHFERWSRECEDLERVEITLGVPAMPAGGDGGTALVDATASYVYRGVPTTIQWTRGQSMDGRISVRVNKGMGPDAVHGKARRKILAAIRRRVEGSRTSAEVTDDEDGRTVVGAVVAAPAITQVATEKPPAVSGEPTEADLAIAVRQYVATLATLEEISACTRLCEQYFGEQSAYFPHWTQVRKEEAARRRDERIEQIRAGRGPRSNGGKS